ncbi:MAG TPA: rubrerythrin family protein [Verrucomicrobiae bacterium]|nr:rubrerythrin family protein [Verrucomicrobiae bacterium]
MSTKTYQNLIKAFEGESQARNKYTFFASIARKEGWLEIAEVFEETARNEKEHAEVIAKLLKVIGTSKDNLVTAIKGETYEYTDMYPHFEQVAREEGQKEAANYFKLVQQVEEMHAKRFQALLDSLENNTLLKRETAVVWECRECGYHAEGTEPPGVCPLCGHSGTYYKSL